jgi:uncharacterized protein (TIGR04141 family)
MHCVWTAPPAASCSPWCGSATPRTRWEKKVIYGISLKSGKPLTVQNLFTFAQVSLLQATVALRNSGIDVAVVNIPTIP